MWGLRILLCFLALVQVALAAEVEVVLRADTTQVTLGQPIGLQLALRYPPDWRPDEPNLVELLADASFAAGARLGPEEVGAERQLILTGQARFFALGSHVIPSVGVSFISTSGDTLVAHSGPLDIAVVSVLGDGEEELRDIKPPGRRSRWYRTVVGYCIGGGTFSAVRSIRLLVAAPLSQGGRSG